jgi:hemerythrin superfamily protein
MDLVAALLEDHEEVRALFEKVITSTGPQREAMFGELRAELVRHEVAEEEIVRPLTKRYAPDGERIADARVREESEAEGLLKELEKLDIASREWEGLFGKLRTAVLDHAEKEETVEFPKLQGNVDPQELERKAATFEKAKTLAPTHPHPATPNSPAANLALGPLAALIDRTRDAISNAISR